MNRQTLVIGSIGLAGLASAVVINLMLPRAEPPKPIAKVETPAPRPVVKEAPKEAPPAPESPRPLARRAPPPKTEPEPSPPPAPIEAAHEAGILRIDSDVPGARVFIDRQYVGTTPVTAEDVAPGTHQLNVSAKGYDSIADTIDVSSGPRDILLRLGGPPRLGDRGGAQAPHQCNRLSPRRRSALRDSDRKRCLQRGVAGTPNIPGRLSGKRT